MPINAVSSPAKAATQAIQQTKPQKSENQKAAEEAARTRQAKKPEQPKPVVNAQGQTTGRVVHTTA